MLSIRMDLYVLGKPPRPSSSHQYSDGTWHRSNLETCVAHHACFVTLELAVVHAHGHSRNNHDHVLADSTAAVVCRLMRRVSVSVISIRLLWRCRGKVVWVSSTPMPRLLLLLLLLLRVRVPGAIRQLWWFIRLAGTGIKVDY